MQKNIPFVLITCIWAKNDPFCAVNYQFMCLKALIRTNSGLRCVGQTEACRVSACPGQRDRTEASYRVRAHPDRRDQFDQFSSICVQVEHVRSFQGWISVKANPSFMCNGNNELPDSQPEIACKTVWVLGLGKTPPFQFCCCLGDKIWQCLSRFPSSKIFNEIKATLNSKYIFSLA